MCIITSLLTEAIPRINAAFGQGSGPILLDLVRCNGLENTLFDCGRGRGIEPNSCGHHQDAGVVCAEGEGFQATSLIAESNPLLDNRMYYWRGSTGQW